MDLLLHTAFSGLISPWHFSLLDKIAAVPFSGHLSIVDRPNVKKDFDSGRVVRWDALLSYPRRSRDVGAGGWKGCVSVGGSYPSFALSSFSARKFRLRYRRHFSCFRTYSRL